jgi:hypothetical protein
MNSFFKTPENIGQRRKRLKIMSIINLILVIFNITTKYLLNKLTFNILIFDTMVILFSMALLLISIYGKNKQISKIWKHKNDNKTLEEK